MPTGVYISSLVDAGDKKSATLTLQGTPSGALSFVFGRTADVSKAVPCVFDGANPYVLDLGAPGPWCVWAKDSNGTSALPAGLWIGGVERYAREIGKTLRDSVLKFNQVLIEAALANIYGAAATGSPATLKQVVYGFEGAVDAFPAIIIQKPNWRNEWITAPYGMKTTFRYMISCVVEHNDETSELDEVMDFANAVQEILNQVPYVDLTLPSGLTVQNCYASEGNAGVFNLGDRWASAGNLIWQCELDLQKPY